MPIYEFRCGHCESEFERIVLKQGEPVVCPQCGDRQVERVISAFAVGGRSKERAGQESGPCHCGAPRRGMCQN